jgi:lipase
MLLEARQQGPAGGPAVVCVHGLAQHGGIFAELGQALGGAGRRTVAADLRGHGSSGYEPPWSVDTHVDDLLETADALGVAAATWIGHSFGGLLVAALAVRAPERVERLVLLDPGIGVPPAQALAGAERDRLDWSFATAEGAANALLSSETVIATPPETVAAYVADDLVRGSDGRLRFRYCPSTLVTAWSEMALPPPAVASLPTLLVRPVTSAAHSREQDLRYRRELGPLLKMAAVPNGHNVLWEAPTETAGAILDFLAATDA